MVCIFTLRTEPRSGKLIKPSDQPQGAPMKILISSLLAVVFALGSVSVMACGDKAKDEKQMSTPAKPKV